MPNDEIQMTKEIQMTNVEKAIPSSIFGFRDSFVIWISSFVIYHIRHSFVI
jgi:hypothetical protein